MARGRPGAFGGRCSLPGPSGSGSRRSSCSASRTSADRCRSGRSTCSGSSRSASPSPSSTAARCSRASPSSVPPLVYLLARMAWIGFRRGRRGRDRVAAAPLAGLVARRRDALPARLPDRPERRGGAARDRRRLRRRDRRRPHPRRPRAVRRDARHGDSRPVRRRRTRTGRSASGSSRTAAASRPTPAATPTALLPISPTSRRCSRSAGVGSWDALPAAHADRDRLRPAHARGARARRPPLRRRRGSPPCSPSAGSPTRSRPTRCSRTRTTRSCPRARVGLLARVGAGRAGRGARASRRGRSSRRLLLAPLWLSYRAAPAAARSRRSRLGFALVDGARVLDPPARALPRRRSTRRSGSGRSRFQLDRESPFSIWGWGQYQARGIPDLASLQTVVQVGVIALARRGGARPAREGAAGARRADGGGAARLRALADALVLPLPSLGAAVRAPRRVPAAPGRAGVRAVSAARGPAGGAARRRRLLPHRGRGDRAVAADGRRRHRHPALPDVRGTDRERARAVPRLRLRVPAGGTARARAARAPDGLAHGVPDRLRSGDGPGGRDRRAPRRRTGCGVSVVATRIAGSR